MHVDIVIQSLHPVLRHPPRIGCGGWSSRASHSKSSVRSSTLCSRLLSLPPSPPAAAAAPRAKGRWDKGPGPSATSPKEGWGDGPAALDLASANGSSIRSIAPHEALLRSAASLAYSTRQLDSLASPAVKLHGCMRLLIHATPGTQWGCLDKRLRCSSLEQCCRPRLG